MGLLGWRGWDRLDDLDRRTGLRREWSEASITRTRRFLWFITAMVFVSAVASAVQGDWPWAIALGATAGLSVFTNRRAIRRIRERTGLN